MKIKDNAIAWLVNPSYQLTDDVLLYSSASAGEKSGAVAFDNQRPPRQNVEPEKSLNFEAGIKSLLLRQARAAERNVYYTRVADYQNVTSEPDADLAHRLQLAPRQHPRAARARHGVRCARQGDGPPAGRRGVALQRRGLHGLVHGHVPALVSVVRRRVQ